MKRLPRPRPPFHPRVRSYTLFHLPRGRLSCPRSASPSTVSAKRSTSPPTRRSSGCCATRSGSPAPSSAARSEEHTSELQSRLHLVCRLLLEKKKNKTRRAETDRFYENPSSKNGASSLAEAGNQPDERVEP